MSRTTSISIAEQGRSVLEGSSATDDASTFFEILAAPAAQHESRTTLSLESTCTDVRY